jgi:hypothetical protein
MALAHWPLPGDGREAAQKEGNQPQLGEVGLSFVAISHGAAFWGSETLEP